MTHLPELVASRESIALTPHPAGGAWRRASKLLVVRLDNLGDVLMTTPAFAAITAATGARLTLLTSPAGAAAGEHVPSLADVMVYDAPWVKGRAETCATDLRTVAELARQGFDAAIIFTTCTQSALAAALLCRMAGIPLRLAYSRENPYHLLTHWLAETDVCRIGMRHEVQRQLDLVRSVGFETADQRLSFRVTSTDRDRALRKLAEAGVDVQRPWVVVHPGSSAASRRYPAERFGRAAGLIAKASGAQIVFAGGDDERAQVSIARAAMGATHPPALSAANGVSLAGALSLVELAALIEGARLVVCNNSGPAHLAAATATPVVVLYALTNPQHTPWQVASRVLNHDVPCRNCLKSICPQQHHRCLLGVEPEQVAAAALQLLQEEAPASAIPAWSRPRAVADAAGLDARV